ncbi:MAG: ABC transporter permease [Peptococcaceae bacterium]|nr:ABC transporter permease [Peptococcaceae bacterium]
MLFRKMKRDLLEHKGAYAACVVVIAIGLTVYVSMSMIMDNLLLSRDSFYAEQNFADGFIEIQGYPYSQVAKLAELEGINQIQGRIVKEVLVEPSTGYETDENIYLRLISVDTSQVQPINDVLLLQGYPLESKTLNLWVDNKFYEAHGLELHSEIQLLIEGSKKAFRIVGMGQNPEFIYAMRSTSDLFPNPETFGIGYLPIEIMQNLFKEKSLVNNLVFTLEPNADWDDVKANLEAELKPYGLKSIYPRKDQISNLLLTQELQGLQATAQSMPILFLAVAAMIQYIMLKRMIEQQRTQLGTLKAFGYTNREILWHYLSYALVTGLVGGLAGGLGGFALTDPLLALYGQYFNMPGLKAAFSPSYFLLSILLALLFSLIAGYQGCKRLLTLQPAEAMRPVAPPSGKSIFLEKLTFFWGMLTVQGKMALRNMFRHKLRTAFLFLGIMFTFTLLALPWSFKVISEVLLFEQFEKIETYDVKISLATPLEQKAVEQELSHFPGVRSAEALAEIPVTINHLGQEKSVNLIGIKAGSNLYNILDNNGSKMELPAEGAILISDRLAKELQAVPGTLLAVESPFFVDPKQAKSLAVAGIIPQSMGLNAYMEIEALHKVAGQGSFATSVMLSIEEQYIPRLKAKYNDSKVISGIENRLSLLRKMKELMTTYKNMIYSLFIFGIVIGFAIIYNTSVITLSERSRELASMMVLGMTPKEVLDVITFEQWFISFFAMLAGIPMTKALMVAMADSMGSDLFGFPAIVNKEALIIAFIITVISILIAQLMAARKLRTLSLVEVLKSRE